MSEQKTGAICIGEVLIQLTRGANGAFALSCGGDVFNTAIYLARAGIDAGFVSAVGDDPYSDGAVALAAAEGLATDLILRVPGRLPALCLTETGPSGSRVMRAWHDGAPVHDLFELPDWMKAAETLIAARLIYFSGITLSLLSNNGLGRLFAVLEVARQQGASVAFDGNFRPAGWRGDLPRTRTVFMEALKRVDIALSTTKPCFGVTRARRLRSRGCKRSASAKSWSRMDPTVRSSPRVSPKNSCQFPRSSCRSIRPPPATASMPAISLRGFPAATRHRRPPPRTVWLVTLFAIPAGLCRVPPLLCTEINQTGKALTAGPGLDKVRHWPKAPFALREAQG
jgi:pfkB family carbohydrate kinase